MHNSHSRDAFPWQDGPLDEKLGGGPGGETARKANGSEGAVEAAGDRHDPGPDDGAGRKVRAGWARGRGKERGEERTVGTEAARVEKGG